MKLRFDADLPFQRAAIDAVVGLFAGQPLAEPAFSVSFNAGPMFQTEFGVGNELVLDDAALLANLQGVQEANGIPKVAALASRDFAVEMETGAGKTYVYLRTAFELHAAYGFTKFVIVVPSVAIREGVMHGIETMREHFQDLYSVPFDAFVYDSKQLGRLRQFATANTLQFMIVTIQAFQRDAQPDEAAGSANVIYREQDRLSGHRPIDFLQATHPIVILDEPQKLEGEASRAAIARLHPLCTLRYSATYDSPNKIYRLGPIEAMDQKLVKRIEVASVREEANLNAAYVRLLKTDGRKQTAQVEMNVGGGAAVKQKKVTLKQRDDLAVKSENRQEYRDGFIVQTISFEPGNEYVEFSNGVQVTPESASGSLDDAVMREQVRETVREHLEKEQRLRPLGIKVLSLFFIDRVANYRVHHDDGSWSLGKIGAWFEEEFRELAARPAYAGVIADPVESVHDGYFSKDARGGYKDTGGESQADVATYDLIMRDKERLLSFETPLRFIFSHSALREGWDNPNVFQICTLNESRSAVRKRQEIGRGLRLPVNQEGERVHDEAINRLTVVANESYRQFAAALQTEYEEETGVVFGRIVPEAFAGIATGPAEAPTPLGQDASRAIWNHLRERGYLENDGTVRDAFNPRDPAFTLDVPPEYDAIRPFIVDAINGHLITTRVVNKRDRQQIAVRRNVLLDEEFKAFWERVAQRTRYRITLDSDELVRAAAARIRNALPIQPIAISIETAQLAVGQAGVEVDAVRRTEFRAVEREHAIPDVLAYLQNETELTRQTLARILVASGRADDLRVNPQAFISMATREITGTLRDLMIPGITYERLAGQEWDMRRLEGEAGEELTRYLTNLYAVQNERKTPFDYIEYQSAVEKDFAKRLDQNERVKFFVKLPSWFKVDTPVGPYNPDWAILLEGDSEKLYLVRETKGSLARSALRQVEQLRTHWAALRTAIEKK